MLTFQNREFRSFDILKKLVPQNCLVGSTEKIPGLIEGCFPIPRFRPQDPFQDVKVTPQMKTVVYLHNLKLSVTPAFESRFK